MDSQTRPDVMLVMPKTAEGGICKFCRRQVIWIIVSSSPGRPARTLPFNVGTQPVGERTTTDAGLVFEPWPAAALHTKTCHSRPKPDPTVKRLRRSARDGQGRMW